MKNYTIPAFIGGFVCACLLTCPSGKPTYTPQKSGSFDTTTPMQSVVYVHGKGKTVYKSKTDTVMLRDKRQADSLISIIEKNRNRFMTATDSAKVAQFDNINTLRSYAVEKKDSNVKINVSGLVLGSIGTMAIDYTIEPQKCPDAPKKRIFYGGVGLLNGAPTLNAALNIGRIQLNGLTGQGVWGVGVLYGF